MAAEAAKLRSLQSQDYVPGERVCLDSTYFDDPKNLGEVVALLCFSFCTALFRRRSENYFS